MLSHVRRLLISRRLAVLNCYASKTLAHRCSGILGIVAVPNSTDRDGGEARTYGLPAQWISDILQMIWPSASQASELLNGFQVRFVNTGMRSELGPQRHKSHTDDAFGIEDSNILQKEHPRTKETTSTYANMVQGHDSPMMSDFGVQATGSSTSDLPRSEWWSRTDVNQNIGHPQNQPFPSFVTSSPGSGSPVFLVPQDRMDEWNDETHSNYTFENSDSPHFA
jgi:hypothetical protein